MTRRPTLSEMIWPDDPSDVELAISWARSVTVCILDWMWRSFDAIQLQYLSKIDFTLPMEQIERDLARIHFVQIQKLYAAETQGFSSFHPASEWPEMESRSTASAKPPAYDFAFVAEDNKRWAWPLEAQVLSSSGSLGEYLNDVNQKFVAGIAAPLIGEGAMIGYLLFNDTELTFTTISKRLDQSLERVDEFHERAHRVSWHIRESAPHLRLHHLLMVCVQ